MKGYTYSKRRPFQGNDCERWTEFQRGLCFDGAASSSQAALQNERWAIVAATTSNYEPRAMGRAFDRIRRTEKRLRTMFRRAKPQRGVRYASF